MNILVLISVPEGSIRTNDISVINYQHLLYFWAVARRGSVAAAASELRLSAPTLSAQIRKLEEAVGEKLLRRSGRRILLTDAGRLLTPYAEEIFALGQQVTELFNGRPTCRPMRLAVGMVDVLPRWLAYRLVMPALRLPQRVQLIFREDRPERLLAELAAHDLDIVFSDAPAVPTMRVHFSTQLLGECDVGFYAIPHLAAKYRREFPGCLDGAPLLLLGENTVIGHALDSWLESQKLRPVCAGRFDDFALARVFAEIGEGILAAPSVTGADLEGRYAMTCIGRISSVRAPDHRGEQDKELCTPGKRRRAVSGSACPPLQPKCTTSGTPTRERVVNHFHSSFSRCRGSRLSSPYECDASVSKFCTQP